MMTMTIMSSRRVKPEAHPSRRDAGAAREWAPRISTRILADLPCGVLCAVEGGAVALGVDVEDVLAAPGRSRRRPGWSAGPSRCSVMGSMGMRRRNRTFLSWTVDAVDQGLQVRRVAEAVGLDLNGSSVGGVLVAVDGVAHLPEVAAELPLLLAFDLKPGDGEGGGGEDGDDGDGDDRARRGSGRIPGVRDRPAADSAGLTVTCGVRLHERCSFDVDYSRSYRRPEGCSLVRWFCAPPSRARAWSRPRRSP